MFPNMWVVTSFGVMSFPREHRSWEGCILKVFFISVTSTACVISLLTQNLFNNSANMSRISLKFDTETLKTTEKNFDFKHLHSGLFSAELLYEVKAELAQMARMVSSEMHLGSHS